jgi:beta-lactamase regulating signal transducer with metallopeptidase domain/uncharacterized GH25 family protein
MNDLLTASHGLQPIIDAPVWVVLLLKATAILFAAWLAHLAIRRTNPRWRVFLWRVTAVSLITLPAIAWLLPALEVRVEQSPTIDESAMVATTPHTPLGDWAVLGHVPIGLPATAPDTRADHLPPKTVGVPAAGSFALPQVQTATPAPSEPSLVTMPVLLLAVWLGGIASLTLRLCIGHYRIWRMVGHAQGPPERIRRECLRVARAIGCRRRVEVLQSTDVQSPFLCGLRGPLVLLPARMCDAAYRQDLPGILAHELTHVRSRDVLWNVGLQLISTVLWFHPLVWRIRKAHLAACELVCDAVSASFVGDVTDYCRTLARVAVDARGPLPTLGIAMARTSAISHRLSALRERVFHMPLRRRNVTALCLTALLAVVALGALQFALAASPSAETVAVADQETATPSPNESKAAKSADSKSKTQLLRVRVVDGSGKPLGGTKLKVAYLGNKADYISDAQGEATVVVPAPNAKFLSIIAYPDGYPPMRKWWRNDTGNELIPAEFTFAYERGRTIGGTVRDEQGKPIQGVKVQINLSSDKYQQVGMCLFLLDDVLLTDAQGRWHLDHVPHVDSISVGLKHPDYISDAGRMAISATKQRKIEDRTAVAVMKKGIPLSGTVTDPDGKPAANATVRLGEWHSSARPSVSTDQKGYYRFASLAPGGTILTVTSPGLAPGLRSVNVQSRMTPVDFQLAKGNTLRVRVVGKDGKPISGIFVTPDTWRGKRVLCDLGIRGKTDAEGRWTWTWAPKDAVETDFFLTGKVNYMRIHHLPLVPQETEHVVTLYPALTISGSVIDAQTKQPIPNFRVVRGSMSRGSIEQMFWDHMQAREGKNGKYELMISQPSRTHLVRIEADGYQPAVSREFKNDDGTVTCDFSLDKGQNLNVAVLLPDGNSAAGADVVLCPEEPGKFINMALFVKNGRFPYRDPARQHMKVGSDGQLQIEPQDNDFLLIVLHDQGFAQTTSQELIANPQITLKAWARLEGVLRHGTKPVPGAKLDVHPNEPHDPRWSFLSFHEQTEADAEGKFVFAKLKPGKWRVRELPAEPGRSVGPQQHQKAMELAPGQTLNVTLGGTGRPVVGRVLWPGGKPPQGDLSRIGADLRPKMPEPPSPPKASLDQGPDAVRAWKKQWMESEEGKAWQAKARRQAECPRIVSVNRDGTLRIEDALAGQFELGVYVKLDNGAMPWERPEMLRYACDILIPEIPGGVSDQSVDLGDLALQDKSPKRLPSGPVKPPAPQAPGTKSAGGLRDHLDLLRYVVATYKENKGKIQTWQGRATIENKTVNHRQRIGHEYSGKVRFVFDRARKSVRWNTTLEKWTRSRGDVKTPQPVPQISNGMQTPEAIYRLGGSGIPVNPARRPLTLMIWSPDDRSGGRIQPQHYDFNPLFYLETSRGDVARDLSAYIGWADHPGMGGTKVIRAGDHVTIDMGSNESFNRITLSLSQGCNPISYESTSSPGSTWQYSWTYELHDGVWLPKTWTETVHVENSRDSQRKVTFVENRVNQEVEPAAFSFSQLGLQQGDNVNDRRTGQKYQYEGE